MKSTFTVLFIIQKGKPKADGRVPIMARITINGKMAHFSTKFDILPERWLPKECKTLGQTPDEKIINKSLDALMVLVKSRYNDMTRIGETITADKLKNSVMGLDANDQKEFIGDLKTVYQAPTPDLAELNLAKLDDKWGQKYPVVLGSWRRNWDKLTAYFAYDGHIRRLIYTTNAVEGFHRQVRKVTKTKGVFPNDMALMKLIYLAVLNISKKWTQPLQNWALTAGQLRIKFGERMPMEL